MAIQDNTSAQSAAPAPQNNTRAPAAPQAAFNAGAFQLGRPPMERNPGGEFLGSLTTKLGELVKTSANNLEYDLSILNIDNTSADTTLMFSVVIVAATNRKYSDVTAYHTLVLEATADRVPPKFENTGAAQVEVLRVTSDSYDSVMVQAVAQKMRVAYPQAKLLNADACVVPRTFNLNDHVAVHALLANAFTACHNEILVSHPDFKDVCVASTNTGNNVSMTVQHRFERDMIVDAASNPIRRDVIVGFSTQQNQNQQNASLNAGQRVREVSAVGGYIDMTYMPLNPQNNVFMQPQQFQDPKALVTYAGRLVITDINTRELCTPASQLLSIATAMTIRDNNAWYTTFYNQGGSKKNDLHDIGAIGYEVNVAKAQGVPDGTRIDTKTSTWGPSELGSLMSLTFHQGLMVSLDVPDCGPQTWYSSVFAAACKGNRDAYDAIYNAANTLTGGQFAQLFQKGNPIFADQGQRFHMGYWTDEAGIKRDIRDIDYLAVLNLAGDKNPSTIADWSNSWNNVQQSVIERLAMRKRILMSLVPNVEFTSFGTRLTFDQAFLSAIAQGCAVSGLRIAVRDGFNTNEFMSQRGIATLGSAMLQNGNTAFVQGFTGNVGGNQASNTFFNKWSN